MNIRPAEGLMIDSSLSYLDFEYSDIDPQAGGPTNPGGVQLGMRAPYTLGHGLIMSQPDADARAGLRRGNCHRACRSE